MRGARNLDDEKGRRTTYPPALLAAQRKLESLREQHRQQNGGDGSLSQRPSPRHGVAQTISRLGRLPDHLGWESEPLTTALRTAKKRAAALEKRADACHLSWLSTLKRQPSSPSNPTTTTRDDRQIKLYPDIALGMLRQGHEATGRIWLLLKYADGHGRGWFDLKEAVGLLTYKGSRLRVCGQRQLRKLLVRGEGIFWQRRAGRIWLRSTIKVAAGLVVHRLTGRPVALPVESMVQGMGMVRAHLYASFHSGRSGRGNQVPPAGPIARATLEDISRIGRRTQRLYEQRVGVRRQFNYAIGGVNTPESEQESAWQHGRAVFRFTDFSGKIGNRGVCYTGWQLPNNYFGPHAQQSKGRQKRMNRELADLFMKGMTGNGKELIQCYQTSDPTERRRFYDSGLLAATSYNRSPNRDHYWRNRARRSRHGHLWHVLPNQSGM